MGIRVKVDSPADFVKPPTDVDVGTAVPLPGRFVQDWLRGQSGETRLMERDGELHVFTGRFTVVQAESATVSVTAADATALTSSTDADEEQRHD
jgi:hypothetical protein